MGAHEAFALAQGTGVDLRAFQRLVHQSAGQSWATDAWLDTFQPFEPARAESFYHQLQHAIGFGEEFVVPLPGTVLAEQFMAGLRESPSPQPSPAGETERGAYEAALQPRGTIG